VFISVGSIIEEILFDLVGFSIFLSGTVATWIVAVGMVVILTRYTDGYRIRPTLDELTT
jgi:hypothetical protein